jgi:hypothetical protein
MKLLNTKEHISLPLSLAWAVLAFVVTVSSGAAFALRGIQDKLEHIEFRLQRLEGQAQP